MADTDKGTKIEIDDEESSRIGTDPEKLDRLKKREKELIVVLENTGMNPDDKRSYESDLAKVQDEIRELAKPIQSPLEGNPDEKLETPPTSVSENSKGKGISDADLVALLIERKLITPVLEKAPDDDLLREIERRGLGSKKDPVPVSLESVSDKDLEKEIHNRGGILLEEAGVSDLIQEIKYRIVEHVSKN